MQQIRRMVIPDLSVKRGYPDDDKIIRGVEKAKNSEHIGHIVYRLPLVLVSSGYSLLVDTSVGIQKKKYLAVFSVFIPFEFGFHGLRTLSMMEQSDSDGIPTPNPRYHFFDMLFPLSEQNESEGQTPTSSPSFRWYDLLLTILSIGLYLFDIGTDINLCVTYHREYRVYLYFELTLAFIIAPCYFITSTYLTALCCVRKLVKKLTRAQCAIFLFVIVLQLGPLLR